MPVGFSLSFSEGCVTSVLFSVQFFSPLCLSSSSPVLPPSNFCSPEFLIGVCTSRVLASASGNPGFPSSHLGPGDGRKGVCAARHVGFYAGRVKGGKRKRE